MVVYVKPRRHRMPVIIGEYLNGDRHWLCVRNNTEEEIIKWVKLLRCQNGHSSDTRLRKLWHTDVPSIQGAWTPYTYKNPEINTIEFPAEKLSTPLDIEQSATEKLIELFKQQKLEEENLNNKRGE